jgi:hypothetical protein
MLLALVSQPQTVSVEFRQRREKCGDVLLAVGLSRGTMLPLSISSQRRWKERIPRFTRKHNMLCEYCVKTQYVVAKA